MEERLTPGYTHTAEYGGPAIEKIVYVGKGKEIFRIWGSDEIRIVTVGTTEVAVGGSWFDE